MGFFSQFFDISGTGEVSVLCPFPHAKGLETNPSAHVNLVKDVFHCKTCAAEGRFSDGGLSEAGFVSNLYSTSYTEAIKIITHFQSKKTVENWDIACNNLLAHVDYMPYLQNERGLTEDTIRKYALGFLGDGIVYPVFINGILLDKRTYVPNGTPKIRSEKGASPLLFPFDEWQKDERDTVLCAGENDTLLLRQMGFNAITSTGGEGNFPKIFINMFKGKSVYICYDCDIAGVKGAHSVAFKLREAGASVKIINLGLTGEKHDKDVTDFFLKRRFNKAYFQEKFDNAVTYTNDNFFSDKNEKYPLVDLWDVPHGEYSGKRLSSRVVMMGKIEQAMGATMRVPVAVDYTCHAADSTSDMCDKCPLHQNGDKSWWILDDTNLDDLLLIAETDSKKQDAALSTRRFSGQPYGCEAHLSKIKREQKHIQRVIFSPDVETEDELSGFRMTEIQAYTIGLDLEDGGRYRAFFRSYPHPKNTAVVMVVDRVEESDNAINTFHLTAETIKELEQFQGKPEDVMAKRLSTAKQVVGSHAPREVVETVDIVYHSVLDFEFFGQIEKGHPEALIIGPTRSGKSSTAKKLQQFYGVGNFTECKTASTAGLLGGAQDTAGGFRIKWGKIPANHRGLLCLDELSGLPKGVMASLTGLRSERIATVAKIVSGKAPAKTRLLWMSNTRVMSDGRSKKISLYPNGTEIVLDLIGSAEDVSRFDFVLIQEDTDTYIKPFTKEELEKLDRSPYRNLLYWAWSRKPNQVKFAPMVEDYIWQVAQRLNERFDTDVKFFGAEAHKKLARIAISVACMCFSHTGNYNDVLVSKDHVDWACGFLMRCYDNHVFRLQEYAQEYRATMETNEEVNNIFAAMVRSQPLIMKTLSRKSEITLQQLQMLTGLERDVFSSAISTLVRHSLIESTGSAIMPTIRFRLAQKAYSGQHLIPLSERSSMPI